MPLSHPPGHAQADFGEALVVIGGAGSIITTRKPAVPKAAAAVSPATPPPAINTSVEIRFMPLDIGLLSKGEKGQRFSCDKKAVRSSV